MSAAPPSRRRRGLRTVSALLIVSGALLLADAGATLVWQEPLSWLYAKVQQGELADELAELERAEPQARESRLLARLPADRRLAFAARSLARDADPGEAIGRITLPRIGLEAVLVQGTDSASLRKGPGHYPETPLPGVRGTVAIAGHRTTYGAPFRKIDQLRRGDAVTVRMPYATFSYEVERSRIVAPTAVEVTRRVAYDRLVLSACHPLYSAAQRIVVFARLVDVRPRGPAPA